MSASQISEAQGLAGQFKRGTAMEEDEPVKSE